MPNFISEDDIEQAVLQKLQQQHGFQLLNCYTADADNLSDRSNRTNKRDVIFVDRLKAAALRLNPSLPEIAIDKALAILTASRSVMSSIAANRELDGFIRDGISTDFYLAVSQLWIKGEHGYRRPDILLYINGLSTYW
jgi:type I restriction enzyme, R subunit